MFSVTVAAKFSTHAKIKYTELYLIDLLSLGLVNVNKIHQFLTGGPTKKMHARENWFLSFGLAVFTTICGRRRVQRGRRYAMIRESTVDADLFLFSTFPYCCVQVPSVL